MNALSELLAIAWAQMQTNDRVRHQQWIQFIRKLISANKLSAKHTTRGAALDRWTFESRIRVDKIVLPLAPDPPPLPLTRSNGNKSGVRGARRGQHGWLINVCVCCLLSLTCHFHAAAGNRRASSWFAGSGCRRRCTWATRTGRVASSARWSGTPAAGTPLKAIASAIESMCE